MPTGVYHRKPMKEETKKKISLARLKPGLRRKISLATKGENNPNWKGDKVGYIGLHAWLFRNFKKSDTCEHCGKTGLTGHKIHWANKDHKYRRVAKDWMRLCPKCHQVYDIENNNYQFTPNEGRFKKKGNNSNY